MGHYDWTFASRRTRADMNNDDQILKSRDDKAPLALSKAGAGDTFRLAEGTDCSWLKKEETVDPAQLRARIEPWLTALFQSEHFALLVGSGLSHACLLYTSRCV